MLLLGEGSEATEPCNKYDKIRPHSIRSLQFDPKGRPLSFGPEKFDLFTATHIIEGTVCRINNTTSSRNFFDALVSAKDMFEKNQHPPPNYEPSVENTISKCSPRRSNGLQVRNWWKARETHKKGRHSPLYWWSIEDMIPTVSVEVSGRLHKPAFYLLQEKWKLSYLPWRAKYQMI